MQYYGLSKYNGRYSISWNIITSNFWPINGDLVVYEDDRHLAAVLLQHHRAEHGLPHPHGQIRPPRPRRLEAIHHTLLRSIGVTIPYFDQMKALYHTLHRSN